MSNDDSWALDSEPETPKPNPVEQKKKVQQKEEEVDCDEQNSKPVLDMIAQSESKDAKKEETDPLEESNWLDNPPKDSSFTTSRNKNQKMPPNTSFLDPEHDRSRMGKELERDEPNTTWLVEDTKNKQKQVTQQQSQPQRDQPRRGNRNNRQEGGNRFRDEGGNRNRDEGGSWNRDESEREPPRRGNRNNRDEGFQEGSRRGNREPHDQQYKADNDGPRRGNRNREDRNYQNDGDFKKKKYDGQYQPRENQYDRGGEYRGRGNRGRRGNYHNNNYNNYNSNYNNNSSYNSSSYSNNNNRQFRPKFENNEESQSNTNNFTDREEKNFNRFEKKNEVGYGSSSNTSNNTSGNFSRNYNQKTPQISNTLNKFTSSPSEPNKEQEQKPKTSVGATAAMLPKGRKCWPETSISILGCKLIVTCRQLIDFECKLLVVPYATVQMEYYPGNAVNLSTVDYRKKILSKGDLINQAGSVYLQKAFDVYSYQALAFLKINPSHVENSLKAGVKELLRLAQYYETPITLETMVFAICEELGDPSWVIKPFIEHLQNCKKTKQVWITTIQPAYYVKAAEAFTGQVEKMFKSNEIFIN